MTSGSPVFLVDTNVITYAYDPTDGDKRSRAIEVLARIGAAGTGALSVQVMGEFFVTVTRKIPEPLSLGQAEERLEKLRTFLDHLPAHRTGRTGGYSRGLRT